MVFYFFINKEKLVSNIIYLNIYYLGLKEIMRGKPLMAIDLLHEEEFQINFDEFQSIVLRIAPHMRKQDMRLAFDTMHPTFKLVSKLAFFK
jgi:hypothetical protein